MKKPELPRRSPVRAFGGLFGPPPPGAADASRERERVPSTPSPAARGAAAGYQVIDEYLRQGRELARALSPTGMFGDASTSATRATERMAQAAFDLAATWLEYTQAADRSKSGGTPGAGAGPFDVGAPQAASSAGSPAASPPRPPSVAAESHAGPHVVWQLRSARRVEVRVDAKPGAARCTLVAHDLRARDPALPRMTDVAVETRPEEDTIVVRIDVADHHAATTYSGVLVDEATNLPQATIAVRVFDG